MGRDRDPFDRTLDALRQRLEAAGPLQGRALAINALAAQLGVSPTPVREVLARLAGEGLIDRTAAGYVGTTYDAARLAELYDLCRLLTLSALARGARPRLVAGEGGFSLLRRLAVEGGPVLGEAFDRADGALAPFRVAEMRVCGGDDLAGRSIAQSLEAGPAEAARAIRRHDGRRRARGREILAAALLPDS